MTDYCFVKVLVSSLYQSEQLALQNYNIRCKGVLLLFHVHIKLHIPTHRSTSMTEKLLSGMIIPRPSFFATSIGLLKPFFSKVSTVSSFPFASLCTMFPSLTIKQQTPLNQKKNIAFEVLIYWKKRKDGTMVR